MPVCRCSVHRRVPLAVYHLWFGGLLTHGRCFARLCVVRARGAAGAVSCTWVCLRAAIREWLGLSQHARCPPCIQVRQGSRPTTFTTAVRLRSSVRDTVQGPTTFKAGYVQGRLRSASQGPLPSSAPPSPTASPCSRRQCPSLYRASPPADLTRHRVRSHVPVSLPRFRLLAMYAQLFRV